MQRDQWRCAINSNFWNSNEWICVWNCRRLSIISERDRLSIEWLGTCDMQMVMERFERIQFVIKRKMFQRHLLNSTEWQTWFESFKINIYLNLHNINFRWIAIDVTAIAVIYLWRLNWKYTFNTADIYDENIKRTFPT